MNAPTSPTPHLVGTRIRSIGVRLGSDRRDNHWYARHYPEVLAGATERALARAFTTEGGDAASAGFDAQMKRYVEDPFRGAKLRYKLGPDETCLSLELAAAHDALAAANLQGSDIDCILCASWLPERYVAPGNAAYLARALGTAAPGFNIETACSSGLAGLELAEGLLALGRYKRILLVLSNTVSRQAEDANTLSWISSDTAAAAVLEGDPSGSDLLASFMENTSSTCDTFVHEFAPGPRVTMAIGPNGAKALRDGGGPEMVGRLCGTALERAATSVADITFFGCSTPLAWFAELCRGAVGVAPERINDLFPRFGNVGLPFPLVHLYYARKEGRLAVGDPAMLYTVGSTSSAGAMVLRGGDWALGPDPEARASQEVA